jgi:hypothetical protein
MRHHQSLRTLELHVDPQSDIKLLDDALARMQAQEAAEGVTSKRFLATGDLGEAVGMKEDFACMNRDRRYSSGGGHQIERGADLCQGTCLISCEHLAGRAEPHTSFL